LNKDRGSVSEKYLLQPLELYHRGC